MRVLAAMIMLVLFASSPAYAANELQGQPLAEVQESGKKHGVVVEKLNAADTEKADAVAPGRPRPSTIYLLTLGDSVIVALVHDGIIILSSNPLELETVNKVLGRTGA
jgi:hypothetical protein